ncbi:hypothetical protein HNR32_000971 [Pectinatus brassicae]|uniref:Uncharacterized protein n=1 Tax=Pectinatus brassicae TaxID=862415 RepID=A0A840UJM5_9FIRM|nr:hypothetical protein [Pectinatus brassicae]
MKKFRQMVQMEKPVSKLSVSSMMTAAFSKRISLLLRFFSN